MKPEIEFRPKSKARSPAAVSAAHNGLVAGSTPAALTKSKPGGSTARRAKASGPGPVKPVTAPIREKTADEVVPPRSSQAQSAEPSRSDIVPLLSRLTAGLPASEAKALKAFIKRLERDKNANRERQAAFRAKKKGHK